MTFSSKAIALACASMAFAGAAMAGDEQYFDRMDKITSGAGNAVAHNMAVQTINPWPRYVGNDRISVDGKRIGLGYSRYQANKSLTPRGLSTSGVTFSATPSGGDNGSAAPSGGASDSK